MWPPVLLTLERGQIDLLLLAALAGAWRHRHRPAAAGALLALAVMGKPLILGAMPLLLCARHRRWAAATGLCLAALMAANVLLCGWTLTETYVRAVLPRAARFGEGGPASLLLDQAVVAPVADDLAAGVARIDGRGRAFPQEIGTFPRNASLPRALSATAVPAPWLTAALFLGLAAALAIRAWRTPTSAGWYWGALLAATVAAPVSWAMDLVWALPLLAWGQRAGWTRSAWWLRAGAWGLGLLGPFFAPAWIAAGVVAVAGGATSEPATQQRHHRGAGDWT